MFQHQIFHEEQLINITKVGDLALIEDKDKIYLPKKHLVEYERYYDKFKNYMSMGDGQSHMMMAPERIEAFYKAQCLKDDTMAESIVELLKEHKRYKSSPYTRKFSW